MIKIPKKITQNIITKDKKQIIKHYELIKIYPNHILYKCLETGFMESFSKNEFVEKQKREGYNK